MENKKHIVCLVILFICLSAFTKDKSNPAPPSKAFIEWQKMVDSVLNLPENQKRIAQKKLIHGLTPPVFDNIELLLRNPAKSTNRANNLPVSFDLRNNNMLTSVKDQTGTGNCWAFATIAALESNMLMESKGKFDFSEKNMRNHKRDDTDPILAGANKYISLAYLTRLEGPVLEEDDPFDTIDGEYKPYPIQGIIKRSSVYTTEESIKQAIKDIGALYVDMHYDSAFYNEETATFYEEKSGIGKYWMRNHAVAVVGWDDAKEVPGAPELGAWLIKNSYGINFGDNGFFWLSYQNKNGISGTSFSSLVPPETYSNIYYYDTLGNVGFPRGYDDEVAYGAISVTPSEDEYISAVGTYFLGHNSKYKISIFDTKTGVDPNIIFSDLLYESEGEIVTTGYYLLDIDKNIQVTKGNELFIVVKYQVPETLQPVPMEGMNSWWFGKTNPRPSTAVSHPNETFISHFGDKFEDLDTLGSVSIKVYTTKKGIVNNLKYEKKQLPKIHKSGNSIRLNLNKSQTISYTVFDMRGKTISKRVTKNLSKGSHVITLDSKIMGQGMVLVNIKTENEMFVMKMLISLEVP